MNRTGLFIALSLALVIGLVFGLYPELDLKLAALFFDPQTRSFPVKSSQLATIARLVAMAIPWVVAVPAIAALVVKLARPDRPLSMPGRAVAFLLLTFALSAGIFSNVAFKTFWGRPRPVQVSAFNGELPFMAWWDPRGGCPHNCSFFSGEGAAAFWTYAPAALVPPPWRGGAYAAATLFGLTAGALRMAFGGHFFTDIAAAGLVTFVLIFIIHGWFYRWSRTRLSDEDVDAALTRLARPAYRLRLRLSGRKSPRAP